MTKRHLRPNIGQIRAFIRFFRRVGGLSRALEHSTHVPTPNSHRIVSTTFGDDHLGSIGGKLGDFRFRLRSLTVTKTAQALKLRHPTNRTNLMAVLLSLPIPQLDARVRRIKSEPRVMHIVHMPCMTENWPLVSLLS